MSDDAIAKLLFIARGEIGYHEGRSNGHWNNQEKYAAQVPGLAWVSTGGQPWCATFVSWLALKAGLAALYPCTASTDAGAAWFKDRGEWHDYPAVGAQVFYGHGGDMVHTGVVEAYDATTITTIEGNTNTNGSAEGDGVYRKVRNRHDDFVQGYGYPAVPGGLKSADPAYVLPKAPTPAKPPTRGQHVDDAIDALRQAQGGPKREGKIKAALKSLFGINPR